MRLIRKARFFWVYPLAIWMAVTANTSESSLRLGIALVLLGEAIRLWANGYVGHVKVNAARGGSAAAKVGHLITGGPYAHVRHPLYVGTFLIGLGFCLAVRSVPMALAALAFFLLVYRKKAEGEEQLILGEWGQEYDAYRAAVPRWWPALRPYPKPYGRWSWQGIWASKELKTVIWGIVVLLAVYFREELVQEHERFLGKAWLKHVALAALALILIASDGVLELVRRRHFRLC